MCVCVCVCDVRVMCTRVFVCVMCMRVLVCVCVCVIVCVDVFSLRRTRARGSTRTNETGFYLLLGNLVFRPRITSAGERAFITESRAKSRSLANGVDCAVIGHISLGTASREFRSLFGIRSGLRWRQQKMRLT